MLEGMVLVSLVALLLHALCTHGPWFAGTWLLLTSIFGAILTVANVEYIRGIQYDMAGFLGEAPLMVAGGTASCIYLGGILAKGIVEKRPSWKGRILPFVLLHAIAGATVWLPFEALGTSTNLWHLGANEHRLEVLQAQVLPLLWVFVASGLFGLTYRVVSLRTEDNRKKFLIIGASLPLLVILQLGLFKSVLS